MPIEGLGDFKAKVDRIDNTLERLKERAAPRSNIYFWEGIRNLYKQAYEAGMEGRPLAVTGLFGPVELFHALDVAYYSAENNAIMTAQADPELTTPLLVQGEAQGLTPEICSPHRVAVGLARSGRVPRPDFIVSNATSCDQTLKLYEVLSDLYKCPTFVLDSPYRFDRESLAYAKEDVKELIAFLEGQTGRKLDYDKLREHTRLSKMAYDLWEKCCALRKAVPCPIAGRENLKDQAIMISNMGRIEAVNYFSARYQELKEKVERKEGAIPQERHRIGWLYVLPLFDLRIGDWLQEEFGAVIVFDNFSYCSPDVELDPEDPIDFLAKKALKWGFIRLTYAPNNDPGFAPVMARLCKEYSADVAIVFAHWSCNQYCGAIRLMKDEIARTLGIPFYVLEGDLLDSGYVSSAQMKERLAEFFSVMVEGRG